MTELAIIVEGLSKQYQLDAGNVHQQSLYELLARGIKAPWRNRGQPHAQCQALPRQFWALSDVNFSVRTGEVVGVIGRNGAGKSTLLKILSRITAPTRGTAALRGRLASLLEVGTGFHPELSGRENVFLNGAILGMTRLEITRKFDEIVAFAEVENFIDTPVKRYSSGMYVRLAFGVAAHLDPEILIIDEVLAVGDAKFQKRCLGKMKDVASQGRTVIFVSHNMLAVQRLCQRVVWLDAGQVRSDGAVQDVISAYLQDGAQQQRERAWQSPDSAPGNESVAIARLLVEPLNVEQEGRITIGTGTLLTFEYWNLIPNAALNLSLHIFSSDDTLVLNAFPIEGNEWAGKPFPVGRYRCVCELPPYLLNADRYRVELLVVRNQTEVIYRDDSAISFEVEDIITESAWHGRPPGVVRPRLNWTTQKLS